MRRKGTISTWNDDKGFGFVSPQSGGRRVFVHIKEFSNRDVRPQLNDVVTYALSKDDQGRICAISASIAGARRKKKPARRGRASAIVLVLLFLAVVAASTADGRIPAAVIITYAVLSLIAFIAYAIDKSAARRGAWRIKEGTLHILGLMGGWPGALLAQQTLRHKSKKIIFPCRLLAYSSGELLSAHLAAYG